MVLIKVKLELYITDLEKVKRNTASTAIKKGFADKAKGFLQRPA